MNQITAGKSRLELPGQIAQEPSINRIIEIFPGNEQISSPKARIVIAKTPVKVSSYQSRRNTCHYLLQRLLRSISAIYQPCRELEYSAAGAPVLAGGGTQDLHVSMARSDDWLAVGVSHEARIGVDIERIKPRTNISEKAEFLNWQVKLHDLQDFYAKWTLWEAGAKCVQGSVFMSKNPGFDALCPIETLEKVARSGPWNGIHGCIDKQVFYAVVLQCENNTELSHQILRPEETQPWPALRPNERNQCA